MMHYEPLLEGEEELRSAIDPESPESEDPFGPEAREERLSALMMEVFQGQVGRGRSLKYWENLRLKPQHIQMIVMKAAGYKNNVIAERFGMTQARVSVILNHPDAVSVLSRLVSFQAENLLDIKARIQAHAGEALDTVLTAMRTAQEPQVKAKIGFSLLDRAGYGAVQKSETVHRLELPQAEAADLTAALRESQEIEDADYVVLDPAPKVTSPAGESGDILDDLDPSVGGVPSSRVAEPPRGGQQDPSVAVVRVA